ncbi:site-specific integrase [Halothiobacillus sp.]|uniref:tyrosine-type recombinase/integrase n=1 Tax=Halothiobacillus sp. TaxID=1891311 RepID=UPI0026063B22|nr:site-specific integrase [Halothiobacillus sp.]
MASIVQTPNDTWMVVIRRKGHKPVTKTIKRKTDATKWAQQIEGAIDRGEYSPDRPTAKITFKELVDKFSTAPDGLLSMSKTTQEVMPYNLVQWAKHLGHMRLMDIDAEAIEIAMEQVATRRRISAAGKDMGQISPSTLKRDISALGGVLKWAVNKRIIAENPMRKVVKPKINDARERYLTDDELIRLLDACDQSESAELGIAVRLALFTGMRQADVMGLEWPRINLGDLPTRYTDDSGRAFAIPPRHALVTVTKNGHPHLAPIEGMAFDALKAWSAKRRTFDGSRLVFQGRHNSYQPLDLRRPWETALRRAGIEGFRWHDLRHTFASMMLKTGASHIELAKLTGHRDLKSLMRYAHISPEHSSGLVAKMQNTVLGKVKK